MSGIGFLLQTDPDPFRIIGEFLSSPLLALGLRLVALFFLVLWLTLVYWTVADAGRRGTVRAFWGLVALIFPFVGTLIYVIVRPPEYLLDHKERELELAVLERELRQRPGSCPNCRSTVEEDYLLCPECGWDLKKPCGNCLRPLRLKWSICPYCRATQEKR